MASSIQRSRSGSSVAARGPLLLAGMVISGCFPSGPEFPNPRQPRGVRVLGAVAAPASGTPGGDVDLKLELFDGGPLLAELRQAAGLAGDTPAAAPLSVAWLGGCHNPPGDAQSGCYPLIGEIAANLPDPLPESNAAIPRELRSFFAVGNQFSLHVPESILEGRQLRTAAAPFGVSFTFFAVCRGVLRPALDDDQAVPLRCEDRDTGEELGSEAFVSGFVTTYTYEGALNHPPVLSRAPIDGVEAPVVPCESDADCAATQIGELATACARPLTPELSVATELAPQRCLPVVSACSAPPCASHQLSPELSPTSVEPDPTGAAPGAPAPDEIVWVRYFGFGGFNREQALINDRATGLNPDYALSWSAPPVSVEAPVPVWAIVQDNRGGTAVARWDFLVRTGL
ncbi:MAG TPA: hypothetical protein VFS67_01285 [Polyangiaceae bacterium]|nr:hypothetical protein [Polyangiaceae bacterium]